MTISWTSKVATDDEAEVEIDEESPESSMHSCECSDVNETRITSTPSFAASPTPTTSETGILRLTTFQLALLATLVAQTSGFVLLTRYTRSHVSADQTYDILHVLCLAEALKLVLSCIFESITTNGGLLISLKRYVWERPRDAATMAIPAVLYLAQNVLLYVALSNLTAPLFHVIYQSRLVITALVSVLWLDRTYQLRQWISLVGISCGVAMVVHGEHRNLPGQSSNISVNLLPGLTAVILASLTSAVAGVYFEKVVKAKTTSPPQSEVSSPNDGSSKPPFSPPSLWMRNIQLAFFSLAIAYIQGVVKQLSWNSKPNHQLRGQSFFHGFDMWTWILILVQAGGGLLVAVLIKHTDNVLKGLATGVSVVVSSSLSLMFFGTPLGGPLFFVGTTLILASVWFFSNPLPPMAIPKTMCCWIYIFISLLLVADLYLKSDFKHFLILSSGNSNNLR